MTNDQNLHDRERQYRAVIETAADGFWMIDVEGRILEVNEAYVRRSGYTREELLGMGIARLEVKESPAEIAEHIGRIVRDGSDIFETRHRAKDGTVWQVEVNAAFWPFQGGRISCFLRDTARRKRSDMILRMRFELSRLADRGNVSDLLQHALDCAELLTGSSIGFFHFVDEDQEHLTLQAWSTNTLRQACSAAGKGRHYPISKAGVWVECFRARAPVIHDDYAALANRKGMPDGHAPVSRELVLPVLRDGKVAAIAGVGNKTSAYVQEDVEALQEIATVAMDFVFRNRAEASLRESETLLRHAQRLARLGNWRYDLPGGPLWWSDELHQVFAMPPGGEPLSLELFLGRVHPDDREALKALIASVRPHRFDYRIVLPDGAVRHIHEEVEIQRDESGTAVRMTGIAQDVTDQREAFDQLRASNERFRLMFERHDAVMLLVEAESGRIVEANAAAERFYGYPAGTLKQRSIQDINVLSPAEVADCRRQTNQGSRHSFVFPHRLASGEIRHVEVYSSPVGVPGKSVLFSVIHDVTARSEAEAGLRRWADIFDNARWGIAAVSADGTTFEAMNRAFALMHGRTADELVGQPARSVLAPESRGNLETHLAAARRSGHEAWESTHVRKDGSLFPVLVDATAVNDAAGRFRYHVENVIDITERKREEDARERLTVAIAQAAETVVITDALGSIQYVNPMFETVTGFASAEAIGQTPRILKSSEHDAAFYREMWETIAGGGVWQGRVVNRKRDGSHYTADMTISPVHDATGRIVSYVAVSRDITEQLRAAEERARLEVQLQQAQKMESIGTLAGGVAHDFNNILSAVVGYGHLALMKMAKDDPVRTYVEHILDASNRGARLTQDLLLFSRRQPIARKPVDVNAGIRNLGKLLTRVIGEDIAFKLQLSETAIPVLADEHQISQVLMNLATNARDAMPRGGVFTISTGRVLVDAGFAAAQQLAKPGTYAQITVSDTGCGMDEQTRKRIFEPFYTTKEPGKGTGLGMAVVYGIVTQHDGAVTVESAPGRGTTFRICLPVISRGADEVEPIAEPLPPAGGTETILLAEDDETVREMMLSWLQDFGYTVITAVDGNDAVRKFRESQGRIDLLLFDLIMPKRTGADAYAEIRQLQPGVKIVFASGYDADMVRQKALLDQGLPIIRKPAEMSALLKVIRSQLDS